MNTYVHVNSGNRDVIAYPYGNTYSMYLPYPIKNITKVEVIVARVPNTIFNVTSTTPQINISGTLFQIPTGFYSDPATLATAIHQLLPAAGKNNVDFNWLVAEGKFIFFSNTQTDYITVLTDDMATLLGFTKNVQYTVSAVTSPVFSSAGFTYYTKSPTIGDMSKNDFLFLNIAELSHEKFQDATSKPYNAQNATGLFTGITMDVAPNTVKIFKNNDYPISICYDPPISSVDRLTISWYDKNRNLVNFQGLEDNAVILRFTMAEKTTGELDWVEETPVPKLPPLPPPPIIKEKKTWGRWFFFMIVTAIIAAWSFKIRSRVNSFSGK